MHVAIVQSGMKYNKSVSKDIVPVETSKEVERRR